MPDLATGTVFITRTWIPKLISELARISEDRKQKLDQISLDFPNPEELARFYVEPCCQRINPANLPDGTIDEYRTPVFENIDYFLNQPSLDGHGANHRIILGDAGMGKSSLLVMLWKMHLFNFWPKDVGCTLLKLGRDSLERIAQIPAPSRHILLLDALDEDPSYSGEAGGVKARLSELITASMAFRKVIISCRTQFFVDEDNDPDFAKLGCVRLDSFTCSISYLSPFDDSQARDLLEKRFPNTWRQLLFQPNNARKNAIRIAESIGSLSMRPLMLSYITFILGDNPNAKNLLDLEGPDREYKLYGVMITRWLDREVLKIKKRGTAKTVPRAEDLRQICWQVATLMRSRDLRKLPRRDFENLKRQLNMQDFLADDTLEGRTLLNKDSAGNFRFTHSSIEEFLVVEHLLTLGPLPGADLKPSRLMRAFYEQRIRANYRSLLIRAKSLHFGSFETTILQTTLSPTSLLLIAENKFTSTHIPDQDAAKKIVLAALIAQCLADIANSAAINSDKRTSSDDDDLLQGALSSTQIAQLRQANRLEETILLFLLIKLEGETNTLTVVKELEQILTPMDLNALRHLDKLAIVGILEIVARTTPSNVDIWTPAQISKADIQKALEEMGHLNCLDRFKSLENSMPFRFGFLAAFDNLSQLDLSEITSQIAVGIFNLSIPETRISEIFHEEIQAGQSATTRSSNSFYGR
ncbi:NACHT domain-containing protein [Nannocystaceae bacterium ST9]